MRCIGWAFWVAVLVLLGTPYAPLRSVFGDQGEWVSLDRLLKSSSHFPARILAIEFPNEGVLDDSHGLTWGKWTATFGSGRPTATWNPPACVTVCEGFRVDSLACTNSVVGERKCYMRFSREPDRETTILCELGYLEQDGKTLADFFFIKCPSRIRLE